MSVATLIASHNSGDNWVLSLNHLKNHGLVSSLSDGSLKLYPLNKNQDRNFAPIRTIKAHNSSINASRSVDGENLIGTASTDGIKIFDLRNSNDSPVATFNNPRNIPFLSLDFKNNYVAGGTELKQADAELHIWDLRTNNIVRSFVDSHHDDITEIKFHPTDDSMLLSGSTDDYVNIYDLSIPDEDDALHQVINFNSIHSAGWLSPTRIYTLSHMETFAIHELNDKSDDSHEPKPLEFGDIREPWDCEYVVDVYPGFIATGSNSKANARLYPFINEQINLDTPIKLNGAHGEEVVRTVYCPPNSNLIYTGGEDGNLRIWKSDIELNAPETFFQISPGGQSANTEDVEMGEVEAPEVSAEDDSSSASTSSDEEEKKKMKKEKRDKKEKKEKKDKKDKKEKKEKKDRDEKKDKKDKKEKKDKKHKSDKKSKKEHRFKPY